jgi:hypothetical protein
MTCMEVVWSQRVGGGRYGYHAISKRVRFIMLLVKDLCGVMLSDFVIQVLLEPLRHDAGCCLFLDQLYKACQAVHQCVRAMALDYSCARSLRRDQVRCGLASLRGREDRVPGAEAQFFARRDSRAEARTYLRDNTRRPSTVQRQRSRNAMAFGFLASRRRARG